MIKGYMFKSGDFRTLPKNEITGILERSDLSRLDITESQMTMIVNDIGVFRVVQLFGSGFNLVFKNTYTL